MPLFDFKNRETGEVREIKASSDLDNFKDESGTWFKLEVQPGFAIGGQRSFPTQAQTMKRGYYRQENSKRGWRSTYSKNKVKRVWGL
jgi:hypothetical protein